MAETDDARCQAIRNLVPCYLTESLSPTEREQFAAHLATCAPCRAHLAAMEDAAALSCQALVELVTDYLEGALSPAEQARFETHLALCEGCRDYLAQLRETIRLTGRLTEDAIPPAAKAELLSAFRNWQRG